MDRCADCGATLYGAAQWCGQCLAPVRTPNPFAPRAAQPGAAGVGERSLSRQDPPATVATLPTAPPPWARPPQPAWTPPRPVTTSPKSDEGRVAKPLGLILLLGFVVQVALHLYGRGGEHGAAHLIRMSQWAILGFYAVVLALVVRTVRNVDFLPVWSRGPAAENAAIGALKGVVTATVVLLLVSGATGRVQVAPSVKFQLGDATVTSVALALLLLAVAAPVVEELLFRGMVAEAMRHRGQVVALVASGVLFALWHMRFGAVQIVYYTVLGIMLGRTYWKRGLVASTACHAGFNGALAVVALVFIIGPGSTISANGISVEAPGGWDAVDTAEMPVPGAVLAAHGPSGAVFYVVRTPIPPGFTSEQAMASVQRGLPGVTTAPGTVRIVSYPAGEAVRLAVTVKGNASELAVFPTDAGLWVASLEHGTDRSRGDFEEMLESLDLSG